MIRSLLFSTCWLAVTGVAAQRGPQVPAAVLVAFQRAQPRAAHVVWHPCPVGYEAAFEQQLTERLTGERKLRGVMSLTPTGELIETRLDVPYRTFPPLGHTAISQQYPHRQLDRVIRVVNAKGEVTYETKICPGKDKNGRDLDCQTSRFDENGRPLAR